MRLSASIVVALVLGVLVLMTVPAAAGHIRVVDRCTGVDHFPQPRPRDQDGMRIQAPSVIIIGLSVEGAPEGSMPRVRLMGAGNSWTQDGMLGDDGRTFIPFGIFQYGEYSWSLVRVRTPDGMTERPAAAGSITVNDAEPACSRRTIRSVEPPVETTEPTPTASPSPTQAPSARPTPSATTMDVATTDDGNFPWWVFIPGGFMLAALGGLLMAKNPCPELFRRWRTLQDACDQARAAAEEARAKADAAREAEAEAAQARRDAFEAFHSFRRANPMAFDDGDGGSWVEDSTTGERITSRDLALGREAAQETWDEYQSSGGGQEAAEQAMEEWSEQGTAEGRQERREADEAAREKAKDLEQKLDDAKAKENEAEKALEDAEAAADVAARAADEACAKAAAAAQAWKECVDAKLAPPPASTGGSDEGEDEPGSEPGGTAPPPGPGPSGEPQDEDEDEHTCCSSGVWVGYGWSVGGILIVGRETTGMTFFCVDNPSHTVTLSATVWRLGLGLGGEAGAAGAVIWGATHPFEVTEKFESMMGGPDADLSLGPLSAGKALKLAGKGIKARKLAKVLKRLGKSRANARHLDPRDLQNIKDAVKGVGQGAAQGGARSVGGQMGAPDGVVIPVGAGLQAGVWWKFAADLIVTEYECCSCTQDGVLPGHGR